jgi:small subunit ribosomal protein S7
MSRRSRAERREPLETRSTSPRGGQVHQHHHAGREEVHRRVHRLRALDVIEEKSGQPGLQVFNQAVQNAKPALEVKSRRVGGATYQVPVEVRPERRTALAIKWLISFSRKRGEKSMAERLAAELMSASRNEGATIKKKEDTHRMADANKAFAHYRW